ncbi:hypothetical protein INR49_012236 [Caranx melampygus]|nr:hypothetical protein INR49_012236 [Caranx melampygus]
MVVVGVLVRVYQFSKRHALEECRQQVALSQGVRAKLEAQRLLLKEKLEQLGFREPPPALTLDSDTVSISSILSNDHSHSSSKLLMDGIMNNLSGLFKPKCEVCYLVIPYACSSRLPCGNLQDYEQLLAV